MSFYFAWVGGDPIPPLTVATKGDVWGGSVQILGDVWGGELSTTGDLLPGKIWSEKVTKVTNLRDISALVSGAQYTMTGQKNSKAASSSTSTTSTSTKAIATGTGIAEDTTFTFDGVDGGSFSPAAEAAENAALKFKSEIGRDQVYLYDISPLTSGDTYTIEGSGIPDATTFDFLGDNWVTISKLATTTGSNVELTIRRDTGRQTITNIADTSALVVGETYQIFGRGLASTVLGVYQSDGTLALTEPATISTKQTFLRIHRGTIYPDGGAFDQSIHTVTDENVLSVKMTHKEGNFALLTIDLKNPHTGLLATGRNVWCWLSWREATGLDAISIFHGRLLAVWSNIQGEKVTIQFVARPSDYESQQALLMATLREAPYYDRVWLSNGVDDATTILEARTAEWHIDRKTLAVTISDITIGEDDTLVIGSDQPEGFRHIYDSLQIRYGSTPLAAVYVTGSVTWTQTASGTLDITDKIVKAFQNAGSKYSSPNISSYAGDGLFNSWPKPGTSIGGGWSVGLDVSITDYTDTFSPKNLESIFTTAYLTTGGLKLSINTYDEWATLFPLNVYNIYFPVDYQASREYTENVSFFLEADIQQIHTDSKASVESFSLSSSLIRDAIDDGGLTPLRDARHNTYFKTARGQDSVKFLLAYARAKLVARARAVEVTVTIPWKAGLSLSCRQNATITDRRLPGGTATGKIIEYELIASERDGMRCVVTIGCSIGKGGSVAATDGDGSYAASGYMAKGYQSVKGGTIDLGDNTVTYESFDDFDVEDDGVNFLTLSADSAVKRVKVSGGITDQRNAISMVHSAVQDKATNPPDPVGALKNCYTLVTLEMVPVTGGAFLSEFAVDVSKLQIPKTIDLGAS